MEFVQLINIVRDLNAVHQEMGRCWNLLCGEITFDGPFKDEPFPLVDISETRDSFIIRAALPGVDEDDVDINVLGDILVIKGEKKKLAEEKDTYHYFDERYDGPFQRQFQLPTKVKCDEVETKSHRGILNVTLHKVDEVPSKKIEVKNK